MKLIERVTALIHTCMWQDQCCFLYAPILQCMGTVYRLDMPFSQIDKLIYDNEVFGILF